MNANKSSETRSHTPRETNTDPANAHNSAHRDEEKQRHELGGGEDIGKDLRKQLLSVICVERVCLESCQEVAAECFQPTETLRVSVPAQQSFHICGRESAP